MPPKKHRHTAPDLPVSSKPDPFQDTIDSFYGSLAAEFYDEKAPSGFVIHHSLHVSPEKVASSVVHWRSHQSRKSISKRVKHYFQRIAENSLSLGDPDSCRELMKVAANSISSLREFPRAQVQRLLKTAEEKCELILQRRVERASALQKRILHGDTCEKRLSKRMTSGVHRIGIVCERNNSTERLQRYTDTVINARMNALFGMSISAFPMTGKSMKRLKIFST